jgi:hypothetical protein
MSSETQELIRICEALPEAKRVEVTDFARFLLAQQADAQWERIIADPNPRPRPEQLLKESRAEGSEPLDLDRLSPRGPGPVSGVRINEQYRAVGERDGDTIEWAWIGSHNEFDSKSG